jgi:hypothetical protein
MIPFGSNDRWTWSSDAFAPLWFCVRTLTYDGLRVPPFDQHPDGDGRLRALGLDADMWQRWVAAVLRQNDDMGEFARSVRPNEPPTESERQRILEASNVLVRPGSFCPGPNDLKRELDDMFVPLYHVGEEWRQRAFLEMLSPDGSAGQARQIWKGLLPFHKRLPTFKVFIVEYPAAVVMTVPPSTAVISPATRTAGYGQQVIAAASTLADAVVGQPGF